MKESICKILIHELLTLYKIFPHVAVKLEVLWGTKRGHEYLKSILTKDRDARDGFPLDIYDRLVCIYIMHVNEVGDFGDPITLQRPNANITQAKPHDEMQKNSHSTENNLMRG